MAVTATPIFTQTPKHAVTTLATANTDLSGATTTNIVAGFTAGANGSKLLSIVISGADAGSLAGMVNIWYDPAGGTAWKLYDSHVVTAITPAAGTAPFRKEVFYETTLATAGATFAASTYVTDGLVVHWNYGDY